MARTNGNSLKKSELEALNDRERRFVEIMTGPEIITSIGDAGVRAGYDSPTHGYYLIRQPKIVVAIEERREAKWSAWRLAEDRVVRSLVARALNPPQRYSKGQPAGIDAAAANRAAELYFQVTGRIAGGGPTFVNQFNTGGGREESFPDALERIWKDRKARVITDNESREGE